MQMGIIIKINKKWASYEILKSLYETEKNSRIKIRLLVILLAYEGKKSEEIAKIVKQTGVTVRKYMKRWNATGVRGLEDIPHPEPEYILTEEEMREIDEALKNSPKESGMEVNNWRGWVLVAYIKKRYNKEIKLGTAYNIFHRLGYSKTRAKKQNKKRDPEEAEEFREDLEKLLETKDENTIILYGDEAIFTSEPTATSVRTKVGEQPIVHTIGETRKRTVVFGAVNPESGDLFELFAPAGDTINFQSFLALIAEANPGKNVILIEDNATYHHFKGKDEWLSQNVPNITILYLPSHCSELNSAELLWKDARTNVTHNTLFQSFNDMVDNLREYFANLKLLPRNLMKLCPSIY
jgi:transposase